MLGDLGERHAFVHTTLYTDTSSCRSKQHSGVVVVPDVSSTEQTCCHRRMQPLLVRMLQHPQEALRSKAAASLVVSFNGASKEQTQEIASSLIRCQEDVLGLLLTLVSGEDEQENRGHYAWLLGGLCVCTDATGSKRIVDAGAVPYVLQLLKQANTDAVKMACVQSLLVWRSTVTIFY